MQEVAVQPPAETVPNSRFWLIAALFRDLRGEVRLGVIRREIMKFIIDRLREPSTFAGIAAFLAGFGLLGFTESDWNQVFGAVAAIAGAAAVFLKEGDGGDATDS